MQPQNPQLTPLQPQPEQPIVSPPPETPSPSTPFKSKLFVVTAALIVLIALIAIIYIATKPKGAPKAVSNIQTRQAPVKTAPVKTGITDTWTGKGKSINWSDPSNWSNGSPAAGDNLVFSAINGILTTNNDLTDVTLGSLTFEGGPSTGVNQIIVTGNQVKLSGGISDNTASSVSVDFNTGLILAANQTFAIHSTFGVDPSSSPNLAGTVISLGKFNLTLTGFSNSSTTLNSLSGTGQFIVNLSQDNTASLSINQASPDFNGPSQLNSGTTTVSSVQGLGNGSITIANGAQLIVESNNNSNLAMSNNLTLAGNGPNSYGALVIGGGAQTFTLLGAINLNGNASVGFTDALGSPANGQLNLVNHPSTNGFTLTGANQAQITIQ